MLAPYDNKKSKSKSAELDPRPIDDRLEEALGLAEAIELEVNASIAVPLETIRSATLFGQGKVEELKQIIHDNHSELVVIDHSLSPGQQRNLEREWDVKILDRTGLILEIFGRRAATREGRLQVDLAHLNYQKSRLVRSWTHLERQRGGQGFMGGPGETQLEADKRQLQTRIMSLTKELEKVKKTRDLHRKKRKQIPYPIIALVGYTNAGKSTLFNRLTGADVMAKDQLFATLDPTMRSILLPSGAKVIMSDTVGFVSNLPTQLVAAFRATLEEVLEANIILHVQDASNPSRDQQRVDVIKILKELGIKEEEDSAPIFDVWNKIDQIPQMNEETDEDTDTEIDQNFIEEASSSSVSQCDDTTPFLISAKTGEGIDQLLEALDKQLEEHEISLELKLKANEGMIVNWLYENGQVTQGETNNSGETEYSVTLPKRLAGRLEKMLSPQKGQ
ncbi:MAG: GTPase HflX [Rhodomicrobiaceae bacterium]